MKKTTKRDFPPARVVTIDGITIREGVNRLATYARDLDVHPDTLKRKVRSGELAALRIGDMLYLSDRAVAAWLKSQQIGRAA